MKVVSDSKRLVDFAVLVVSFLLIFFTLFLMSSLSNKLVFPQALIKTKTSSPNETVSKHTMKKTTKPDFAFLHLTSSRQVAHKVS